MGRVPAQAAVRVVLNRTGEVGISGGDAAADFDHGASDPGARVASGVDYVGIDGSPGDVERRLILLVRIHHVDFGPASDLTDLRWAEGSVDDRRVLVARHLESPDQSAG